MLRFIRIAESIITGQASVAIHVAFSISMLKRSLGFLSFYSE